MIELPKLTRFSTPQGFKLEGDKLRVTDPCYTPDTWCSGTLDNVKPGNWCARVGYCKDGIFSQVDRAAFLQIWHESYAGPHDPTEDVSLHFADYEKADIHVGVDSGQAGFFAPEVQTWDRGDGRWGGDAPYWRICKLTTEGEGQFGVIEAGAVSSSGYGDGGYDCFTKRVDGQVVAAVIVFITAEEDEEDLGDPDEFAEEGEGGTPD